jgi:hypothetical protein
MIAEGKYIVLYCFQEWLGDWDWEGISIFRLNSHGNIVELWYVLQTIPKKSPSDN